MEFVRADERPDEGSDEVRLGQPELPRELRELIETIRAKHGSLAPPSRRSRSPRHAASSLEPAATRPARYQDPHQTVSPHGGRFNQLLRRDTSEARDLLAVAQRDVNTLWQMYSDLASMNAQPLHESGAS
jgi:hypothetical protein